MENENYEKIGGEAFKIKSEKIIFIKKIVIFLALIFLIAITIELIISAEINEQEFFEELDKLNIVLKNESQIIYFGDSIIRSTDLSDRDPRSINQFLEDSSGLKIEVIDHGAYHLGIYEAFSTYICSQNSKPKV